jgi:hypothetical protein
MILKRGIKISLLLIHKNVRSRGSSVVKPNIRLRPVHPRDEYGCACVRVCLRELTRSEKNLNISFVLDSPAGYDDDDYTRSTFRYCSAAATAAVSFNSFVVKYYYYRIRVHNKYTPYIYIYVDV